MIQKFNRGGYLYPQIEVILSEDFEGLETVKLANYLEQFGELPPFAGGWIFEKGLWINHSLRSNMDEQCSFLHIYFQFRQM